MWWIDLRTASVGGPVARVPQILDGTTWRGGDLSVLPSSGAGWTLVFHGFNKDRSEGRAQIERFCGVMQQEVPALTQRTFVGVLWPGDAPVIGALTYPTEERDADDSAYRVAELLWWARPVPAPHVVAHSLGGRVALRALDLLATWDAQRRWADEVFLMAAAVDDDCLARDDRYRTGVRNAARVVNLASTEDDVLKYAFDVGDWLAGIFSGGYTRTALGRRGPASDPAPPARVVPFQLGDDEDIGHGDYLALQGGKPRAVARFAGHALTRTTPLAFPPPPYP